MRVESRPIGVRCGAYRPARWRTGAAALLIAFTSPSIAQAVPGGDRAIIDSPGSVNGGATINVAAGTNNQQLNIGVITGADESGSTATASQHVASESPGGRPASAEIAPGSFAGSSGWIAVNGVAGSDNQQANMAAIAFGIEGHAVADHQLSQTRAPNQPTSSPGDSPAAPERSVAIGEGAFADSRGLVQVSLIGGDRNTSANTFALSMSAGAGP